METIAKKSLKQTIVEMLTENTGSHFLDSGGAYGRNWQRNKGKTIADFESQPSAILTIYKGEHNGNPYADLNPTISLYHAMNHALELDDLCHEFNSLECDNWNGEHYGTSSDQCEWLDEHGFNPEGGAFNSYNWQSNFSQVIQGQALDLNGNAYVLLQVHGGCDVRGGYTNAKLFKLSCGDVMNLFNESCGFSVNKPNGELITLDWHGEWIDCDGRCVTDDELLEFANYTSERVIVGDFFPTY